MRMIGLAAVAAVLSVAPAGALLAQDVPENATVVAAAVTDLLRQLRTNDRVPEGAFRYDPRPVERREVDRPGYSAPVPVYSLGERENGFGAAAQAAMRAEAGNIEEARICATESPRSCSLRDAVAVFATSEPTVSGDTAHVVVKALWMANVAKQPVQEGLFRITLTRDAGRWCVARTETLFIS